MQRRYRFGFVTFLTFILCSPARAGEPPAAQSQFVPIDGVIKNRGDRVPLAGVTIALDDGALSTITDVDGTFAFASLNPGPHTVHLRGNVVGALDFPITLAPNKRTSFTWYLSRTSRYSTTVRSQRIVQQTVEESLNSDEVKHIAGTMGDTLKAVQNLPGVARPPFGGGLIVVWGSAPQDTRTYVDGVYIPILYHYSGLRSTVNSDLVSSLNFLPGGYGVDYGRGLGGVIDVESRNPRTDGYHGYAQIDLIDISALLEGPLTKNLSFAAAARVSWLQLFLPAFLTTSVQAVPQYWDYQLRLHYRATPRDDVDLFIFGSDDKLSLLLKDPDPALSEAFEHHIYFHRGLVRWTHRFDGGATFSLTPSIGYDLPYNLAIQLGSQPFNNATGQFEWNLRAVARIPLSNWLRLDAGLDYEGTRFTLDATQNAMGMLRDGDDGGFAGFSGPDPTQGVLTDHMLLYTNHIAPFAAANVSLLGGRFFMSAQLRLDVMSFLGYPGEAREFQSVQALLEPRLAMRVQATSRLAFKASIGVYHQAPDSQDFSTVFGSAKLQASFGIHYVAGIDLKLSESLRIEAQAFYKDLRNLVVRGDANSTAPLENDGIGRVMGGELLIRQQLWKNFFGWVSYTLSRSERRDHPTSDWRLFEYDQTHILTILGSYRLPRGFQLGLRFRYASGNPYTPYAGGWYDVNSDQYLPLYGAKYSARLPSFNQLDLRVDKTFEFNRWKLTAYLDVENVYFASNAEAVNPNYNYTQTTPISGLPFLPVLGVRGEF